MLPNLLLASFAKWSTEAENNEPGFPTCPNLTSTEFAEKVTNKVDRKIANSLFI